MKEAKTLETICCKAASFLHRNSPTILTWLGAVGVVGTAILAAKATPKAQKLIEKATSEKGEELTKVEVVLNTGPAYIPSVAMGVATITCIFGANILNQKAQASLVSAYTMVDNAYKEYQNKVKEMLGEETNIRIRDAIAKDHRNEDTVAYAPGLKSLVPDVGEKVLFYEEYRKGYFEAPMEVVINAEYHLNRNLALRGYVTLNEFYEFLGLSTTDFGDALGWSQWKLATDHESPWIDFDHRLTPVSDDGLQCYYIEAIFPPTADYEDDD